MNAAPATILRQHLIDPEICIRCNTCEETCPVDAISHDSRNYVIDAAKCKLCYNCISPCPTGAIDSWRNMPADRAYPIAEQLLWDSLPGQIALDQGGTTGAGTEVGAGNTAGETPADVAQIAAASTAGQGGTAPPPWSAAHPYVNLYGIHQPAVATVSGNFRLTAEDASSDIRHIVLDFGNASFPVLEGQTIGILPPGLDANGKPHHVRLYSVASPREGERPKYNNLSLTVKRVTEDHEGKAAHGIGSNYLCDLKKGDKVNVVGPYGTSFLMPQMQPLGLFEHEANRVFLHVRRVLVPPQRDAHQVAQPRADAVALLPVHRGTAAQLLRQLLRDGLQHRVAQLAYRAFVVGQRIVEGKFGWIQPERVAAFGRLAELHRHGDQFLDHLRAFHGAAAVAVQRVHQPVAEFLLQHDVGPRA
jgi:NAD-dependent dihydropyrimidine dehydrogenase PreA subunit